MYHIHSLFNIRILFFRPGLNILIFLLILAWKYPCVILHLYLKKYIYITYFLLFVHFYCAVYSRYVFHVPLIELSLAIILYGQVENICFAFSTLLNIIPFSKS